MSNVNTINREAELVGVSRNISRVRELIDQVAVAGFNVIVCGRPGWARSWSSTAYTGNPTVWGNLLSK